MAFVYKRGNIYYVGWREWVVDNEGNKERKQVSKPISPDKKAAEEYAARQKLNAYADKNKCL
jgi:hypothetical protein